MPGWMTHKLESRLPGEISITCDTHNDSTIMAESKEELRNLLVRVKEESEKAALKPVCKIAKETQMYRTVFWTLWEREGGMIWENDIETCIISYKK